MREWLIVGLAVLLVVTVMVPALAATQPQPAKQPAPVQMAQAQPGAAPRAGARPGAGDPQQMMQAMMQRLQLTAAEQQAVQTAVGQKMEANRALRTRLQELRDAVQGQVTDTQAKAALDKYRRYQAEYEKQAAAIDKQLAGKLSARSQARLVALGVLDNGLGGMGMGRAGGGRPGGRAGTGGFRGGAPQPAPGGAR